MFALSDVDRKILAILERDARSTLAEVGDEVGLSPSAVKRRVDRLVRDGVILGFTTVVNQTLLGEGLEAFVECFGHPSTGLEDWRQALPGHAEVIGAYTVAGEADALVRLRCSSPAHLEDTLERLKERGLVTRTRTSVVLTVLTER